MTVGERIRGLRIANGMTLEELADKIGTSKQNLYKYETGIINNIPIDKIELIANTFQVSPSHIMGWEADSDFVSYSTDALTLRNSLNTLMKKYKISKEKLCEDLNLSIDNLDGWLSGSSSPKTSDLIKLSTYFDVEISTLIKSYSIYDIFNRLCTQNKIIPAIACDKMGISFDDFISWGKLKQHYPINLLQKISDFFNVSIDYLLGQTDIKTLPVPDIDFDEDEEDELDLDIGYTPKRKKAAPKKAKKIPVLGHVAAGIPIEAITDILDYEEITEDLARTGEFFGLQIKGDSMEPRIKEGDVVIVREQPEVESGQIAIVRVNGDDATCKKYMKHETGISLVSFNPSYPPMFYTAQEVCEKPIVIIGRVVELRGKF